MQAMLEGAKIKCMLNELSSTVVFERPTEEAFIKKWQLACEGAVRVVTLTVVMEAPYGWRICKITYGGKWFVDAVEHDRMPCHCATIGDLCAAGTIAHVVVMPNISIEKLEIFVAELIESRGRVAVAAARSLAATARALHKND